MAQIRRRLAATAGSLKFEGFELLNRRQAISRAASNSGQPDARVRWTGATLVWIRWGQAPASPHVLLPATRGKACPPPRPRFGEVNRSTNSTNRPRRTRLAKSSTRSVSRRAPRPSASTAASTMKRGRRGAILRLPAGRAGQLMAPDGADSIRVAYDDRYLYVGLEMSMRDLADLRDGLGRRGSAPPSDESISDSTPRTTIRTPTSSKSTPRAFRTISCRSTIPAPTTTTRLSGRSPPFTPRGLECRVPDPVLTDAVSGAGGRSNRVGFSGPP